MVVVVVVVLWRAGQSVTAESVFQIKKLNKRPQGQSLTLNGRRLLMWNPELGVTLSFLLPARWVI